MIKNITGLNSFVQVCGLMSAKNYLRRSNVHQPTINVSGYEVYLIVLSYLACCTASTARSSALSIFHW